MIKNIKNWVQKLSPKQIIRLITTLIIGAWMILSFTFGFSIPLPWGGSLSCGSKPVSIDSEKIKVNKAKITDTKVNNEKK